MPTQERRLQLATSSVPWYVAGPQPEEARADSSPDRCGAGCRTRDCAPDRVALEIIAAPGECCAIRSGASAGKRGTGVVARCRAADERGPGRRPRLPAHRQRRAVRYAGGPGRSRGVLQLRVPGLRFIRAEARRVEALAAG